MIDIQYQQSSDMDVGCKMRLHWIAILIVGTLALIATPGARAGNNAPMPWHSPMHPQFELITPLSNQLNFRFGISRFNAFATTDHLQSALADETTPVFSASALVDWQVLPGGLHLTGGALYGDLGWSNLGHTSGLASERQYRSSGNSSLQRDRNYLDNVKPYLGLGWNDQFGRDGSFRLQLDLGLVFQSVPPGSANSLSPDYMGADGTDSKLGPTFQNFTYTPLFSAGFRYRF